jgi:chromosome segregation ATPase
MTDKTSVRAALNYVEHEMPGTGKLLREYIETLQQQLDAAKQENERLNELTEILNATCGEMNREIETLQQRLKQAEEALEWYANDEQYGRIRIIPPIPDIPILHDCGEIAKNTLSLIKGD